ncbi:MAG: glutamate 5-kinase [Deltaproteobacteria bacterium]|nr:glutamate 5-kinase [Deltaproteobacteria bacterium]
MRTEYLNNLKRITVKLGSNLLTEKDGLNIAIIRDIAKQIAGIFDKNIQVILISSGAMAAGVKKLGFTKRPAETPKRQAAAAVGQPQLIIEYEDAFKPYKKKVAQILLTSEDLSDRKRYLNARNTLETILGLNAVPIINENDTITVESIEFGDNDNLAAMITLLTNADILINLTDIDGLFDKDPRVNPNALMIKEVEKITKKITQAADSIPGALGKGGMTSKIEAAKKLMSAGIPMIIANGKIPEILPSIIEGKEYGTFFYPKSVKITGKKRWIGYSIKPKGNVIIDNGAANAILQKGKSLLAKGITEVKGNFEQGAPVKILNADNKKIGAGLSNYSSYDILQIMGLQSADINRKLGCKTKAEVIHRNNMTIINTD